MFHHGRLEPPKHSAGRQVEQALRHFAPLATEHTPQRLELTKPAQADELTLRANADVDAVDRERAGRIQASRWDGDGDRLRMPVVSSTRQPTDCGSPAVASSAGNAP